MNLSSAGGRLDHVAFAVHSLEESLRRFQRIWGQPSSAPEILEKDGVRVAFVGATELLEPLGPDTTVGRFLAKRGQALHHIALQTHDLAAELSRLESEGVRLIDRAPRPGARGHSVAFIHPESTGGVLVELVERSTSDPSRT